MPPPPSSEPFARWIQRLQDSRKLLEDALARHRTVDLTMTSTKLRWVWEELNEHGTLQTLLAGVAVSHPPPHEILDGLRGASVDSDDWQRVMAAWEAAGRLAHALRMKA